MKFLENVAIKEKGGRYCIRADLVTSLSIGRLQLLRRREEVRVVRKRGIEAARRAFCYEDDEEWIDYETGDILSGGIVTLLNMEVRKYRARKECAGVFDE